jgi:Trk K+ transport system NAD-binding subunit
LLRGAGDDLLLEDIVVEPQSSVVGVVVADLRQRFFGNAALVALKRENHILAPLPNDLVVCAGDILAVVGTDVQLRSVEALCVGSATAGGGDAG